MPTPWERPRAVIELGGGRPLRGSPLGGGRAHLEGAQQPLGLKLGTLWPRSHDLPSSRAPVWAGPADAGPCGLENAPAQGMTTRRDKTVIDEIERTRDARITAMAKACTCQLCNAHWQSFALGANS